VYGNGIVNGQINTMAYTTSNNTYSVRFEDWRSAAITSPYIENNSYSTATSAALLWQTTVGMINSVQLFSGDDCNYIEFNVANIPSSKGVAVLAVYNGSSIMWSWMIWLNSDNLTDIQYTNSNGSTYKFLSGVLGFYTDAGGYTVAPFYQWGRKDPFPSARYSVYDINGNAVTISSSNITGFRELIRQPLVASTGNSSSSYYGILGYKYSYRTRETNLWNAAYTTSSPGKADDQGQAIKTIYDPCPPGYMLAAGNAFVGINSTGVASSVVSTNVSGLSFAANGYLYVSTRYNYSYGSRACLHTYASTYENHYYYEFYNSTSRSSQVPNISQMNGVLPVRQPSTLFISSHAEAYNSNDVTARTISITSSESWTVSLSDNSNWVLSSNSGTGDGSFTIRPRNTNSGNSNKTATLTISQPGHESEVISLTQYYHSTRSGCYFYISQRNVYSDSHEYDHLTYTPYYYEDQTWDSGNNWSRSTTLNLLADNSFEVYDTEGCLAVSPSSSLAYYHDHGTTRLMGKYNDITFYSDDIDCHFGDVEFYITTAMPMEWAYNEGGYSYSQYLYFYSNISYARFYFSLWSHSYGNDWSSFEASNDYVESGSDLWTYPYFFSIRAVNNNNLSRDLKAGGGLGVEDLAGCSYGFTSWDNEVLCIQYCNQ